jgi:RimJ/RimL family protein N-acetyltransferase
MNRQIALEQTFKPLLGNATPLKKGSIYSVFNTRDGKEITLRPLRPGDLDALVPFANSFATERRKNRELGITSMERRMTRTDERKFLEETLRGMAKRRRVSVAAFDGDRMVGHCDITGRASRDESHTGLLGIVVVEGYRGVGLGEEMMKKALRQAFELGIWMVELEVFSTNAPARHMYEKLGFQTVGVIPKKVLRDGRFTDIVRMYIHLRTVDALVTGIKAQTPA